MRTLVIAAALVLLGSSLSHGQEACPMETMKDPKLTPEQLEALVAYLETLK